MSAFAEPACGHAYGCAHLSTDPTVRYTRCETCRGLICSGCHRARAYDGARACFHDSEPCACTPPLELYEARCAGCRRPVCKRCSRAVPKRRPRSATIEPQGG